MGMSRCIHMGSYTCCQISEHIIMNIDGIVGRFVHGTSSPGKSSCGSIRHIQVDGFLNSRGSTSTECTVLYFYIIRGIHFYEMGSFPGHIGESDPLDQDVLRVSHQNGVTSTVFFVKNYCSLANEFHVVYPIISGVFYSCTGIIIIIQDKKSCLFQAFYDYAVFEYQGYVGWNIQVIGEIVNTFLKMQFSPSDG